MIGSLCIASTYYQNYVMIMHAVLLLMPKDLILRDPIPRDASWAGSCKPMFALVVTQV